MYKKILIILIAFVLVIALLFGGVILYSRVICHRSLNATLLMWQLRKDAYTTEEAFETYLGDKRAENAETYYLPDAAQINVPTEQHVYGSMPVFFLNAQEAPETLIIFFPGGSYIDQPRPVHWTFLSSLAEDTGAMIVVPLYPKLPDNNAETAYEALSGFYATLTAAQQYGSLIFMGDSAGGGMALSFAMQLRDGGASGPDQLVLLSPWVDVTMSNPDIPLYEKKDPALDSEMLRQLGILWADELGTENPVISPLYGNLAGLGKIWLFSTDGELLYPDHTELIQKLAEAGADYETYLYPGVFHTWPLYEYMDIPESADAYQQIVDIIAPLQ